MDDHGGHGVSGPARARAASTEFLREAVQATPWSCSAGGAQRGGRNSLFVRADFNDPTGCEMMLNEVAPGPRHSYGRPDSTPSDEDFYQGNFWATIRLLNA